MSYAWSSLTWITPPPLETGWERSFDHKVTPRTTAFKHRLIIYGISFACLHSMKFPACNTGGCLCLDAPREHTFHLLNLSCLPAIPKTKSLQVVFDDETGFSPLRMASPLLPWLSSLSFSFQPKTCLFLEVFLGYSSSNLLTSSCTILWYFLPASLGFLMELQVPWRQAPCFMILVNASSHFPLTFLLPIPPNPAKTTSWAHWFKGIGDHCSLKQMVPFNCLVTRRHWIQ